MYLYIAIVWFCTSPTTHARTCQGRQTIAKVKIPHLVNFTEETCGVVSRHLKHTLSHAHFHNAANPFQKPLQKKQNKNKKHLTAPHFRRWDGFILSITNVLSEFKLKEVYRKSIQRSKPLMMANCIVCTYICTYYIYYFFVLQSTSFYDMSQRCFFVFNLLYFFFLLPFPSSFPPPFLSFPFSPLPLILSPSSVCFPPFLIFPSQTPSSIPTPSSLFFYSFSAILPFS